MRWRLSFAAIAPELSGLCRARVGAAPVHRDRSRVLGLGKEARLSQWDPEGSGDDSNGFEASSEMKELSMHAVAERDREIALAREE